jgi:hypothetical protein
VRVDLPPDLPVGTYDVVLGLYDPTSGLRLPVLTAAGQAAGDTVTLPGALNW